MSSAEMSDQGTERSGDSIPNEDQVFSGSEGESESERDPANHVRRGPGSIEALRFKWSVRREDQGYFVDERIGDSLSAFSNGPMPREAVMEFIDNREREAIESLERTRRKIAAAMPGPGPRLLSSSPLITSSQADDAQLTSTEPLAPDEPVFDFSKDDEESDADASDAGQDSPPKRESVNIEDVMARITRLLDER